MSGSWGNSLTGFGSVVLGLRFSLETRLGAF